MLVLPHVVPISEGKRLKKTLALSIALFGISTLANADVFTIYGSRAAQNPSDIIDWTQLGLAGTQLTTPQLVFTFNGNPVLVGNQNESNFLREDEGNGWTGNFDYGESLVWTGNPIFQNGGLGPFAMVFGNPVGSFGFDIQADMYGPFTATVSILDPSFHFLTSQVFTGGNSTNAEDGSALFVGMGDLSGNNIGAILIGTDSGNPTYANDFAIDDPSFAQTPEPGTASLLAGALLGVAGLARRKLRK
jgi:hypothetical protein